MHALGERAGVGNPRRALICMVEMLDAAGFLCCTLPTVLHQLFAFVFELMFGHRMHAYRLLVIGLCARARSFARCSS